MHVCHVSREMVCKQLKFSRVEQGACFEPYRDFDPDIDAIYISHALDQCWSDLLRDDWRAETARIRHLALDSAEMGYGSGLAGFVWNLGIFSGLRKLSLVCSDEWWELREYDLARRVRYRLVDYPETETASEIERLTGIPTEPWSLARSFQHRAIHEFVSRPELADRDSAPYDESTGKLLFDVVPSRLEPLRESIPKDLAKDAYWLPDIGSLRELLRDLLL